MMLSLCEKIFLGISYILNVINFNQLRLIIIGVLLITGCSSVSLKLENDVIGKSDQNYTSGQELNYKTKYNNQYLAWIPVPKLGAEVEDYNDYILKIRQEIYTPDDLRATEVVEDENPYAGSLTFGVEKILSSPDQRISSTIRIGSSGDLSLAEQVQKGFHQTLDSLGRPQTTPMGWDNQVKTEPLFNFDYSRMFENYKIELFGLSLADRQNSQLRVGNINTDLTLKYGWLFGKNLPSVDLHPKSAVSLYSLLNFYTIGRLQTLYYDGGIFRESVHTVDTEPGVLGMEAGLGLDYKDYSIQFIYNIRTRDYKEQTNGTHSYGLISLGVNW